MAINARISAQPRTVSGTRTTSPFAPSSPRILALQRRLQQVNFRALTVPLLALALIVNMIAGIAWTIERQRGSLQDLGSFLHSAAAYQEGLDPYRYYSWLKPPPISWEALNLNPPISVYLFEPLMAFEPGLVQAGFLAGSVALLAASIAWLAAEYPDKRQPIVLLLTLSLAGVWHTLGYLQIYAPLLLLVIAAWYCMRRNQLLLAGIAIGLVIAIKPNFLLWPFFLLAAGHRGTPVAALVTAAAISVVPLVIDGPGIYRQWFDLTWAFSGVEWSSNASLISLGSRFGSSQAGSVLAVASVLWLVWYLRRRRPGQLDVSALSIPVILLASPASWAGYTLFLLPALFSRSWSRETWISVLLLAVPFWFVRYATGMGPISNALLGSTYAWATLLLLYVLAREAEAEANAEETPATAAA